MSSALARFSCVFQCSSLLPLSFVYGRGSNGFLKTQRLDQTDSSTSLVEDSQTTPTSGLWLPWHGFILDKSPPCAETRKTTEITGHNQRAIGQRRHKHVGTASLRSLGLHSPFALPSLLRSVSLIPWYFILNEIQKNCRLRHCTTRRPRLLEGHWLLLWSVIQNFNVVLHAERMLMPDSRSTLSRSVLLLFTCWDETAYRKQCMFDSQRKSMNISSNVG